VKSLESLWDTGFEEVCTMDEPYLSYKFNTFGVLRGPDGRLWFGVTSGCSCPGSWHEYNYDPETLVADLEPLNDQTFSEFERQVMAFCSDKYDTPVPLDEKKAFIATALEALRAKEKKAV